MRVKKRKKLPWKAIYKEYLCQESIGKVLWALRPYLLGISLLIFTLLIQAVQITSASNIPTPTVYSSKAVANPLALEPSELFHPVWEQDGILENLTFFDSQGLSRTSMAVIHDPDNRVEEYFKVPESLRTRVAFWIDIYSRFTSHTRIIHDRAEPGIVYGYIDMEPIYQRYGNTVTADVKANQVERTVLRQMKQHLQEASGIIKGKALEDDTKEKINRFMSRIGGGTKKEAAALISRIRTQTGQADMFLTALYRSLELLPHIETVLMKQGLPKGLARIPFVESSFNVKARSSDGAVGIWQFMPDTARQMIHAENEAVWVDPIRQSAGAARLLKMYRSVLPDWGSTVTSYNSGVGRVRRLLTKYKVKDVEQLLNVTDKDGLGFAGKNFYAEFLAANLVEAYKQEFFRHKLYSEEAALAASQVFSKSSCKVN